MLFIQECENLGGSRAENRLLHDDTFLDNVLWEKVVRNEALERNNSILITLSDHLKNLTDLFLCIGKYDKIIHWFS